MKAKVVGLDVSEKEKAWSILHPTPPLVAPPSSQQQLESGYVLLKLELLGKESNDEQRTLTIRRHDIAELGLKVGDIINLSLSMV